MLAQNPKFTPGPWRAPLYALSDEDLAAARKVGLNPGRFLQNDGSMSVMTGDAEDAKPIATVVCQTGYKRGEGYRTQCDERDANAHLIASAPDLYAVLAEIYEFEEGAGETDRPMMARAKAALAKAWGEQ